MPHGVGSRALISGVDFSGFFSTVNQPGPIDEVETTVLQPNAVAPAKEFEPGLQSGSFEAEAIWKPGFVDKWAPLIKARDSNIVWSFMPAQDVVAEPAICAVTTGTQFGQNTDVNDAIKGNLAATAIGGIEHSIVLKALAIEVGSASGTIVDNLAATINGGAGYLHVTAGAAFGTFDMIIEHSATGAFGGEETTIVTFTQVTAAEAAQRVAVGAGVTILRFTRARWTFGAGLTSATPHVALFRRP